MILLDIIIELRIDRKNKMIVIIQSRNRPTGYAILVRKRMFAGHLNDMLFH